MIGETNLTWVIYRRNLRAVGRRFRQREALARHFSQKRRQPRSETVKSGASRDPRQSKAAPAAIREEENTQDKETKDR